MFPCVHASGFGLSCSCRLVLFLFSLLWCNAVSFGAVFAALVCLPFVLLGFLSFVMVFEILLTLFIMCIALCSVVVKCLFLTVK